MTSWTGSSGIVKLLWKLGVAVAVTTALPGCFAHTSGEILYDHPVAYVEEVPPRIEYYPATYYHGHPAYLVDGRWYYRHRERWVVFNDEPVELRDYRVRHAPVYASGPRRYSDVAAERRYHAEQRRHAEQRAAERRAEERRAEERRAAERRERERQAERREWRERERIAAERRERERAAERRMEERRTAERRAQRREQVAERSRPQQRRRERNRNDQDDRDDRDDRRRVRD